MLAERKTDRTETNMKEGNRDNNVINTLIEEFEKMFAMENLEKNTYLIFKMNSSLEIPLQVIYKERKIMSITSNHTQILEALAKIKSITIDHERELLRINALPIRNKIIINKLSQEDKDHLLNSIASRSEYINRVNDKYYDTFKSYAITLANEQDALAILEFVKSLEFKSSPEIILEQENPYLNLLQKGQDAIKAHGQDVQYVNNQADNFNYFANYYYGNPYYMVSQQYGYKPYPLNYQNYYYNNRNYHNSMFIRKAEEQEEEFRDKNEGGRYKNYNQKPYYGNKTYKPRGGYRGGYKADNNNNNNDNVNVNDNDNRKPQNEAVNEERVQRTRLNSDNFPPLSTIAKEEKKSEPEIKEETQILKKEKIIHIKKDEILSYFAKLKEIKINPTLEKLNTSQVPVLDKNAKPNLELINPSPKRLPESMKASSRKQSHMGQISI